MTIMLSLPIALGKGPGAASWASMAKVITLLIVPVAYSLFDDAQRAIGRLGRWLGGRGED